MNIILAIKISSHKTSYLLSNSRPLSIIHMISPSYDSLFRIYHSILDGHLLNFNPEVKELASQVTVMTLELYRWVCLGMFHNLKKNFSNNNKFANNKIDKDNTLINIFINYYV